MQPILEYELAISLLLTQKIYKEFSMKQFMTLSAFVLSAACLCVNTQSFAGQSATNQITQGAEDVANGAVKGTENVLKGTGNAIKGAAEGVGQATKKGINTIEKGTQDFLGTNKSKKSN
ncbi:MAG: hypothetical protein CK424_01995 [Legionella sp.]|nr:MAG: hypothetical protein CK424_01995 [Legionella sp.]